MLGRFIEGVLSPVAVLRAAHRSAASSRYYKLVLRQLLATIAIMAVVIPSLLNGLDLAAHNAKSDYQIGGAHFVVVRKKSSVTVRVDDDKHQKKDGEDADEPEPVKVAGARFVAQHAPGLLAFWVAIVSIYGAWLVVEWIIGAISYQYVDDATDAFVAALELPGDEPKGRVPRLRINVVRQLRRIKRQIFAGIVIASGAPLFLLARIVPHIGRWLMTATITAWSLYWLIVTTAAKSDLAWAAAKNPPWYLRAWRTLTTKVFAFRWWGPRSYGWLWNRITRDLHGAAELVEEAPWQMAGLSIVRIVSNIPLIGLLLRPLIPVAATLLVTRARTATGAKQAAKNAA